MRLIAIPFAAGTAYAFQPIKSKLKPSIRFEVFEYPGHGQKMWLPLKDNLRDIAQEMLKEMFPVEEPYCLLGYSMGGHVLCELYRLLIEKHYPLPVHVFLCAIDIPNQLPKEKTEVSDEELLKEIKSLGGTAPEVLENREFMEMLLPIYRADIQAEDSFVLPYEQLFRCEGTVIVGKKELEDEKQNFTDWQRYFTSPIHMHEVKGGHFYLHESPRAFSKIINSTIEELEKEKA